MKQPCGRCLKGNLACSGPATGVLLVNTYSGSFKQHPPKSLLQAALNQRCYLQDTSLKPLADMDFVALDLPRHFVSDYRVGLDSTTVRALYDSLLEDFYHTSFGPDGSQSSIFDHSAIILSLKLMAGLGSAKRTTPEHLDVGIFSLLSLYFGKLYPRHQNLIQLSRQSYGMTVHTLCQTLSMLDVPSGHPKPDGQVLRDRELNSFYIALVLILFELVDEPEASAALDIHIDGALRILQQIGPDIISKLGIHKDLLPAFRSIAYASAVRRRVSLCLDEPQWLAVFSMYEESAPLEHLYDIAVRLPRLLERTDSLISMAGKFPADNIPQLLLDYSSLKSMFQNWYLQQLFELPKSSRNINSPPKFCGSDLSNLPQLATMLLELEMGISDILLYSQQGAQISTISSIYKEYDIIDTNALLDTMTESIQDLRKSSEGRLVTAIPFDTLRRYRAYEHRKLLMS